VALRQKNGTVNPVGLYDLDRKIRPVGEAYKKLISDWCNVLPSFSQCLVVPVEEPWNQTNGCVPDEDQAPAQPEIA